MRATVVVVTYNHAAIIGDCLSAVLSTVPDSVETIVVDNASADGTAELVRDEFPSVHVVEATTNTGYGGGNNLGASNASGEFLVFLNPDARPRAGWLDPLLAAIESDSSVGLTTPKLLLASDPSRIDTLGNDVHLSLITPSQKWGEPAAAYSQTEEVSAISGACFAVRRELFERLGGFDDRYFLYFEDTDLSLRARQAGYRCLAVPESEVVHDHLPGFSAEKLRCLERNRYWTLLKLFRAKTLLALLPTLLVAEALAWGMALKCGRSHVAAKARAWWDLMRWLPGLSARRRQARALRRMPDEQLLRLHSTQLRFDQTMEGRIGAVLGAIAASVFAVCRTFAVAVLPLPDRPLDCPDGRLRIAHVTATFPPYWGGTGNVAWHNAQELTKRGHEVHVFTAVPPATTVKHAGAELPPRPEGVEVHHLSPLLRLGNAPFLPSLLPALRRSDLIHLHYPFIFGAEIVWLASVLFGVPYVVTFHNALIGNGRRAALFSLWELFVGRLVISGAARVLAVSLDHANQYPWLSTHSAEPIVEVPNGVDAERFHPASQDERARRRALLGAGADGKILLFVAALDRAHHFKGLSILLRALGHLSESSTLLVVVGDGDMRATYEREAAQFGVADRVRFVGAVPHDETPAYFGAADIVALPTSPPESFGLVLIEAMACGTPVVASDVPGVRDVVTGSAGGVLVPPRDPEALAAAIDELLADPTRRSELARTGRDGVRARYTWDAIGRRLDDVYASVLIGRHARRVGAML